MSFTNQLRAAVKQVEVATDRQYRAAVIDVFNRVVIKTPVDTGIARASWLAGKENSGDVGQVFVQFTPANIEPIGSVTVMYSNLPYIKRLAEGWSEQAANGWIQRIAATWPQTVKKYEGI